MRLEKTDQCLRSMIGILNTRDPMNQSRADTGTDHCMEMNLR